jgi:hypothetical protein
MLWRVKGAPALKLLLNGSFRCKSTWGVGSDELLLGISLNWIEDAGDVLVRVDENLGVRGGWVGIELLQWQRGPGGN